MAENHSIQSLIGKVNGSGGFSYANRYKVFFGTPKGSPYGRNLPHSFTQPQWPGGYDMLCNSFTWPGNQLTSIERRIGTGMQKVAYGYLQPEITASFFSTKNAAVFNWLYEWQQLAVPTRNMSSYHLPKYQDEYVADMAVYELDKDGNVNRGAYIVDAYPTTVNPVTYSNIIENQIVELTCEFSYRRWYAIDGGNHETPKDLILESKLDPTFTINRIERTLNNL